MVKKQSSERPGDTILFMEHVAGIAGDMFAAACVDAGLVTAEEIQKLPDMLGFGQSDVEVIIRKKKTAKLSATQVLVEWQKEAVHFIAEKYHSDEHHITYDAIDALIFESSLEEDVKKYAKKILTHMGNAEAKVHDTELEAVTFHEIGDIDSIMDVVMAGYCINAISPDQVCSTPVKLGRGSIEIRHGRYPVPPPASAFLAEGFTVAEVPPSIRQHDIELSTPTGLAILKSLSPTFTDQWPAGVLLHQGVGAGSRDLGQYPNVFRIGIFQAETVDESTDLPYREAQIMEIVCNIDDQTPERTAWILEQLMKLGALDVSLIPVTGKKNRLGIMISVLVDPSEWEKIADWLLRHSSTFGVRYRLYNKLELHRKYEERNTPYGKLRYKIGYNSDGEKLKKKPEFDDLREIWRTDPDFKG